MDGQDSRRVAFQDNEVAAELSALVLYGVQEAEEAVMNTLKAKTECFMRRRLFFLFVFVVSMLVMFQRRPYVLAYANFWAEDGKLFFPQMYHDGIKSLFYPYAGYFHLVPRLVMLLTLPFGIINAPLISNFMALVLRAVPMIFLFTRRFDFMGTACRFFLWVYFLIMPNALETLGNITNIQWNLSIYLLMAIIADPPESITEKLHDWIVLILAGLSGPFVIFAAPLMILGNASRGKSPAFKIAAVVLGIVQFCTVMFTSREFQHNSLAEVNTSIYEFTLWTARVICSRVIYAAFLPIPGVAAHVLRTSVFLSFTVFMLCASAVLYGFIAGGWRFRVSILYALAISCSGMLRTWLSLDDPNILIVHSNSRYFILSNIVVFSMVIFSAKAFWTSHNGTVRDKLCIYISVLLTVIAMLSFSLFPPQRQLDYRRDIREKYYPAASGSRVVIPIEPEGWKMTIIQK